MKSYRKVITENFNGKRVDSYLSSIEEIPSRSYAQKLIKDKDVKVNGNPVSKSFSVKAGDVVQFDLADPSQIEVEPENIEIKIHYQDEDLAVVEKPAGMVTHPSYGHWKGTLVNALLYHLKDLSSVGGVVRPGIIHRLDKDTSGLLIVAKNDRSHLALSRDLKERKIKRRYLALVHGHMKDESGKIDMPVGRSYRNRKKMAVISGGREAVTDFKVEERYGSYDLLEISLQTGRTHQIRVHMAAIGHPVVGDDVYGLAAERKKHELNRFFLHAFELTFKHPATGKEMYFLSPLPEELRSFTEGILKDK